MPSLSDASTRTGDGLGQSKTNFNRLLAGYTAPQPTADVTAWDKPTDGRATSSQEEDAPVTEPTTTLNGLIPIRATNDYPDETDQVPTDCSWMDEESVSLIDDGSSREEAVESGGVPVLEYIKQVRRVQRKMNQLTQRRQADPTFMKQELGVLIQTYQLENDQSLDWLFTQQGQQAGTDYGSLFDRIDRLSV